MLEMLFNFLILAMRSEMALLVGRLPSSAGKDLVLGHWREKEEVWEENLLRLTRFRLTPERSDLRIINRLLACFQDLDQQLQRVSIWGSMDLCLRMHTC